MMRLMLVVLVSLAAGCGTARSPAMAEPRNPDVITAAELERSGDITARQAIERLRPRFLRMRGPSSLQNADADRLIVYVDNARIGGVEVLEQVHAFEIREIRYLSAPDATSRYGTGHSGGVIAIARK